MRAQSTFLFDLTINDHFYFDTENTRRKVDKIIYVYKLYQAPYHIYSRINDLRKEYKTDKGNKRVKVIYEY